MSREKFNLVQELMKKNETLVGKKKLALIGQGDFTGANNVTRGNMNIKHHTQHLAIDDPEFPFVFDGKENVSGENSSYLETSGDYTWKVVDIIKKYEERLNGKSRVVLVFLYSPEIDTYRLVVRNEVEDLTENFGFQYNTEFVDNLEVGEIIPPKTIILSSSSYDEYGNTSIGVNGRVLNAVHPAVQDDAIILSESFCKRLVANNVSSKTIPITSSNTILLNLFGKHGEYQGLPNIGDIIHDGILCATKSIKEARMFSDMRDSSLTTINFQTDQPYYCSKDTEIIDINVYCNDNNMKINKVNKQILEYYTDAKWFYTKVYRTCKNITKSGCKNIDSEIYRWKRLAMNYLDTKAIWSWNDNVFQGYMIEILTRKKEPVKIGRKLTGRHGNKTVTCGIWKDEWMPYLTTEYYKDEYGIVHAKGVRERVDIITNPNAFVNRTIPMSLEEGSITFVLDKARKHANTLEPEEGIKFLFEIISILNPKEGREVIDLYNDLPEKEKKYFIKDCISVSKDGLLITKNGMYYRWEPFNDEHLVRDALIEIYTKYGDIIKPYHIFIPKPKWNRDIYIGDDCVGYQYMLMLKQSGEKGFSVRSAGAISDESLPEKSYDNKVGKLWHSEKPMEQVFMNLVG